jgi:putative endonuclease
MIERQWFFYIVKCRDGSFYSGISLDLEERVREHNNGSGAEYTAMRRPVTLVYSEKHHDVNAARKREIQVKGWSRAKKELLIKGLLY